MIQPLKQPTAPRARGKHFAGPEGGGEASSPVPHALILNQKVPHFRRFTANMIAILASVLIENKKLSARKEQGVFAFGYFLYVGLKMYFQTKLRQEKVS